MARRMTGQPPEMLTVTAADVLVSEKAFKTDDTSVAFLSPARKWSNAVHDSGDNAVSDDKTKEEGAGEMIGLELERQQIQTLTGLVE